MAKILTVSRKSHHPIETLFGECNFFSMFIVCVCPTHALIQMHLPLTGVHYSIGIQVKVQFLFAIQFEFYRHQRHY